MNEPLKRAPSGVGPHVCATGVTFEKHPPRADATHDARARDARAWPKVVAGEAPASIASAILLGCYDGKVLVDQDDYAFNSAVAYNDAGDGRTVVGAAGAIMARRFGFDIAGENKRAEDFAPEWERVFNAIEAVRTGAFRDAYVAMYTTAAEDEAAAFSDALEDALHEESAIARRDFDSRAGYRAFLDDFECTIHRAVVRIERACRGQGPKRRTEDETMASTRTPVQLRYRDARGHIDPTLHGLAAWARSQGYWMAERWPLLREERFGAPGDVETTSKAQGASAIAVGAGGIIAVRRALAPETLDDAHDASDHLAGRLMVMVGDVKGAWRKRTWTVPIRIASLGTGQDHVDDEWMCADTLDDDTLSAWRGHWRDSIDASLATRLWEALLPKVRLNKPRLDPTREDTLALALAPRRFGEVADRDTVAQAAGLRAVIEAVDGERGIVGEPDIARMPDGHTEALAFHTAERAAERHLDVCFGAIRIAGTRR